MQKGKFTPTTKTQIPMAIPPDPLDIVPTKEEIQDVLDRGGPWITVRFVSEDKMFDQARVMALSEAEEFYAELGAEISRAKETYQIPRETENE